MELIFSFLLVLILFFLYLVYTPLANPSSAHLIRLLLGTCGLLLMLMTETLYAFRKRVHWFRVGPLRLWLSFHIVTGIVGPCLALLHAGFMFRGLAGLAMLLTLLVVFSGFVGRYIYVAIPRNADRGDLSQTVLSAQAAMLPAKLNHPPTVEATPILQQRKMHDDQNSGLQTAHRWLRWWYIIHIPLGLTLFLTIAVHVLTTIFFGALTP
jgi:hypothetical protein